MAWPVILLEEVDAWFLRLSREDPASAELVAAAIDTLAETGPGLGRPLADVVSSSRYRHMKELRPPSQGRTRVRILFAFDPARQAILLVAGDKAGAWHRWYVENIKIADDRYAEWLEGRGRKENQP